MSVADRVLERAWEVYVASAKRYEPPARAPFGRPGDMPAHVWLVSPDVLQDRHDTMPPPWSIPNPKDSDTGERRLFGWPLDVDVLLPPNSMLLELVTTSVTVTANSSDSPSA